MSDGPDVTGQKMAVGAWHRFPLEVTFRLQKAAAKLLNDAFYAILCCEIKKLSWSDPQGSQGWSASSYGSPGTIGRDPVVGWQITGMAQTARVWIRTSPTLDSVVVSPPRF